MHWRKCCFLLLLALLFSRWLLSAQSAIPPSVQFEGRVVNALTGAPMPGVPIRLTGPVLSNQAGNESVRYGKADDQGRFEFPPLPSGLYSIAVRAPGFFVPGKIASEAISFDLDLTSLPPAAGAPTHASSAGDLTPPAPARCAGCETSVDKSLAPDGTTHASATIQLAPASVIAGRVTDPNGLPLSGVSIQVLQARPPQPANNGSAGHQEGTPELIPVRMEGVDDRGEFRIAPLESGSYYLRAIRAEYGKDWDRTYLPTYHPHGVELSAAQPLQLAPARQVRIDVQIASQGGVRVGGSLVHPAVTGRLPGTFTYTTVSLTPVPFIAGSPIANSIFDSEEQYVLQNVLPRNYLLIAVTTVASGGQPAGGRQTPVFGLTRQIEVGANGSSGLDLELQPLREIRGVASFAEGCHPVPVTLQVGLEPYPQLGPDRFVVDPSDGTFVLREVGAGRVRLSTLSDADAPSYTTIASVRLGGVEVSKTGFDYPLQSDQPLQVTFGCASNEGPR